jgi:ABC-type glutathione transport system ATPase component
MTSVNTAKCVLGLLREISRERGMTLLCSLHQPELAAALADRVIAFENLGRSTEEGELGPSTREAVHRRAFAADNIRMTAIEPK